MPSKLAAIGAHAIERTTVGLFPLGVLRCAKVAQPPKASEQTLRVIEEMQRAQRGQDDALRKLSG